MALSGGYDAHNHLDFAAFDGDRAEVIARARAAGVAHWVVVGAEHAAWERTIRVASDTGGVAILGVHPCVTPSLDAAALAPWLDELARRAPAGIGEIGLDTRFTSDEPSRVRQRDGFRAQLALARALDRPVALHCVRAYPALLHWLARDGLPRAGGMLHAWSGPPELVETCVSLGLHVSVGPLVLRSNAAKVRGAVGRIPLHRLLLETDSPDMHPPGKRRGEPADLVLVAEEVAALRGEPVAAVWAAAAANAARLFPVGAPPPVR